MKKRLFKVFVVIIFVVLSSFGTGKIARADSLTDEINDQIEKVDLSGLEDFFNEFNGDLNNFNIIDCIYNILDGQFSNNYNSLFDFLFDVFLGGIKKYMPMFLSIIAIGILCGITKNLRSGTLSENVSETIFFVCYLSILALILSIFISVWEDVVNAINRVAVFNETLSPILITLMVASGGGVSATIFKPAVLFFSGGVIQIFNAVLLPLIGIMLVFNVVSEFSPTIKLSKFSDTIASIIKWMLGIIFIVMGLFLSVQGIAGAAFDGISAKAAKYAISNSIPIVGGFLKDTFDLVASGSILIKNAIGVAGIIGIFYIVISPLLLVAGTSIMFNLCSSFIEPISDKRISGICSSVSKVLTYMSAVLIIVGVMFFINILLMIVCANSALI